MLLAKSEFQPNSSGSNRVLPNPTELSRVFDFLVTFIFQFFLDMDHKHNAAAIMEEKKEEKKQVPVRFELSPDRCSYAFFFLTQKSDTEATGNTRARGFCLTIYSDKEHKTFLDTECEYQVSGEEKCPSTGRTHWQSYIYFKNPRYFKALKKLFPTAHIETAKGSAKQNREYCIKDGKFTEAGTLPVQGKRRMEGLIDLTDEDIIETDARCHKAYKQARDTLRANKEEKDMWQAFRNKSLEAPLVIYITGKSGKGKSYLAKAIACTLYENDNDLSIIHIENGFFTARNYHAKCLLVHDFRPSQVRPSVLLNFIDKYGCHVNIKGSSTFIKPKCIILDSIISPESLYKKEETNTQFTRRITHIFDMDMFDTRQEMYDYVSSKLEIDLSKFVD